MGLAQGAARAALGFAGPALVAACGPLSPLFAPLPVLEPGTSGLLVEEPGAGLRRFHPFEPSGAGPRVELDPGSGGSARVAVLLGELERLGLPRERWERVEGPGRPLGELGIDRSLVLAADDETAEFREDPSLRSQLAALVVPDLRRCAHLRVRPEAITERAARVEDAVELGGSRALILDADGLLLLQTEAGRTVVAREGPSAPFPSGLAFDPTRGELWLTGSLSRELARARVPVGGFALLRFEAVPLADARRVRSMDGARLGPDGPFVLAVLEADFDGLARVRFRQEGQPDRIVELGVLDVARLRVRVAGPELAYLYSDAALFEVRLDQPPVALSLPGTHSIHSARYSDRFGLLVGLSNGSILQAGRGGLELVLEAGGWWVLDVAPFERGFAYLLANGVVGQFIDGEGRCAETPVLGTLIHGRLVPMTESWFVSGGLPGAGAGTRLALLPRE